MRPISRDDIMDKMAYEVARDSFRRRIMAAKNSRRVTVGGHATFHFETRDTMLYQVHEMLRAEDSWERPGAIEDELDAYNPLIPSAGELSATLMLEYESAAERDHWLRELLGLEDHVWLQVGDSGRIGARFDEAQVSPERISSVQYLRFPVDEASRRDLEAEGTPVRVILDHPALSAQAVVGEETRRQLAADLKG